MAKKKSSYGAEDIEVLEGLEPVRKRPGMYIAGTDTPAGLHQLAFEILDNSVDEAMNGHADKIVLTLHKDGMSISVSDNGRGIPVEKHPKHKKSTLELILTTLHAGGKFSDKNYQTAGGLHGVGSSVVNALSEELIATVKRDGNEYQQTYERGIPTGAVKTINKSAKGSGTTIFFRPDPEIFADREFSADLLRSTLKTKAYLNPGLNLTFVEEAAKITEEICYPEGIVAYLKELLADSGKGVIGGETFIIEKDDGVLVSMALCWTDGTSEQFYTYANGIYTADGGSHELGAKAGIVKALRNYLSVHDIEVKGVKIGAEDIREGILCLVSVKLPSNKYSLQFQGQTKSKLNNPEVLPLVENAARGLEQLLNEKPAAAQAIVNRIVLASKARAASRAAGQEVRRKIGVSHRLNLPGKLADCSSNRPSETELFIVEGDSAGGSTKQGRDRNIQAVLPLRGKVLNTISSSAKKALENKELSDIVAALGCGSGDSMSLSKLRYGKVIILTDADADGMHIATLLMAFFFQHLRPLITNGHLYIGKSPLYGIFPRGASASIEKVKVDKVKVAGRKKPAGKAFWAYSDAELNDTIKKQKLNSPRIVRYKGLGEMNPDTLWDTTLNPENRTLLRIQTVDEKLVIKVLEELMGNDPAPRYNLIQENAESVEVDV